MSSPEIVTDGAHRVVELLKNARMPVTFAQLKKNTRLDEAGLKMALEAAIGHADVFRWPDYSRRQYFWSKSPKAIAQQAILAVASESALSRSNLFAQVRKQVRAFARPEFDEIVASLLSENELKYVPAFTAGKLLIKSGAAEAYAASAHAFLEKKFRKAGFDPPSWSASPQTSIDAPGLILEAVRSLEPLTGVPVSAQRLRNRLPALSKTEFDAAALELRKGQQVFLSLDHDPHNLSPQERDVLIDGRDGTYYVAISIRG